MLGTTCASLARYGERLVAQTISIHPSAAMEAVHAHVDIPR
jgi:hypothetical protein